MLAGCVEPVHPDPVVVVPAVMAWNPHVANRTSIIVRSVGVIWSIANCDRHSYRTIRGRYNGSRAKQQGNHNR
jgi:hypothetical protein